MGLQELVFAVVAQDMILSSRLELYDAEKCRPKCLLLEVHRACYLAHIHFSLEWVADHSFVVMEEAVVVP